MIRNLTPGEWYLCFTCEQCKTKQILFPDLSRGQGRIRATYDVDCPQCGHRAAYDEDGIERYQQPDNAGESAT